MDLLGKDVHTHMYTIYTTALKHATHTYECIGETGIGTQSYCKLLTEDAQNTHYYRTDI